MPDVHTQFLIAGWEWEIKISLLYSKFVTIGFTMSRLHCICSNKISLFHSRKALPSPPESNMLKPRDAHIAASLKLLHFSRHYYCWHALQESQTVKQTLQRTNSSKSSAVLKNSTIKHILNYQLAQAQAVQTVASEGFALQIPQCKLKK